TRGPAAVSGAGPGAAALAEGVLMSMALRKVVCALALALTVALGLGAALWTFRRLAAEPPSGNQAAGPRGGAPTRSGPEAAARAVAFKERKTFRGPRRGDKARVVQFLAFSPDGKRLVEGDSQDARVYDAATGKELAALRGTVPKLTAVNPETGAESQTMTV